MADEMEGETYSHLVVGGGPGGISAVVSLLDHGIRDILWVDPDFHGGRLNSLYREISSNTKTGIYLDALSSSKTCREMIEHAQKPNPITKLEEKDKDQTCELSFAGDMIMFLFDHLVRLGIKIKRDEVREMEYEDDRWIVRLGEDEVTVDKIILATGSHPVIGTIHEKYNDKLRVLDLDDVLQKSKIPALFQNPLPPNNPSNQNDPSNQNSHCDPMNLDNTVIGIIGNSHSGILALRNFFETLPQSTLILFERHDVVYAEYTDDGIIHDNTGLKGLTAEWAKEVLEVGNNRIRRVRLPVDQDDLDSIYARWLVKCHVLVYAIGYERNAIPLVRFNKERIDKELEFDMHSSGFYTTHDGSIDADETDKHESEDDDTEHDKKFLPGLYGCGIAFPEEVKDPGGNVEAAVGIAKFFRFAERVSETWAKTS